jgi:hypothetical protein
METTNIYDILHLLSLIKIRPNMNFGEDLVFAHICHNLYIYIYIYILIEWRKAYKQIVPNQEVKDISWLLFICLLHLVFSN